MLANISHDIKTPLTVILGYLEIIRLGNKEDKTLQKVEIKAKQVMELVNQFFTLAKLEAGDTDIKITKVNISESCRENMLGFYEILVQKEFEVDKNKTMQLMFSYPVKRQKVLASKMIAVWFFNFIALVATKLLLYTCVYIGDRSLPASFVVDFNMGNISFYIQLVLKSMVLVSMGFIALFAGMALKSSKAAIITSFLLIFFTQANIGDFSLAGNPEVPVILMVVSFIFAVLSVRNIETRDLM